MNNLDLPFMENLSALRGQRRWELLLKEMDQIHDTIKNLDDIIFKTKNFGFLFWSGSLYLIVEHMKEVSQEAKTSLILMTALIPLLFWAMDYVWRKHLMLCSRRERHISHFLNSEAFEQLVLQGKKDLEGKQFPFFDVVGWIYTKTAGKTTDYFMDEYLIDSAEFRGWKVIAYKDAKWFYGAMILTSIVFGIIHMTMRIS